MKNLYAISSKGKTLKSFLDIRFGKCENLVIYDPDKNDYAILENKYKNNEHSGIKLVEFLKKNQISSVITGEIGPKALDKLKENKIQIILLEEERIKIEEVISRIKPK